MLPIVALALLITAPQGDVYVADAGTLVISGTAIRLHGVDLPPARSPARAAATEMVQDMVAGKRVTCRLVGASLQNFGAAACSVDGQDIAQALIRQGHAIECAHPSAPMPVSKSGRVRPVPVTETCQ